MDTLIIKVKIAKGMNTKLANMFSVSTQTVSLALSGKSNTTMAQLIRNAAVDKLGADPIYGYVEIKEKRRYYSRISQLGTTGIIAKKFGVTTQTVRNALKGVFDSDLAKKIREEADNMRVNNIYSNNSQKSEKYDK